MPARRQRQCSSSSSSTGCPHPHLDSGVVGACGKDVVVERVPRRVVHGRAVAVDGGVAAGHLADQGVGDDLHGAAAAAHRHGEVLQRQGQGGGERETDGRAEMDRRSGRRGGGDGWRRQRKAGHAGRAKDQGDGNRVRWGGTAARQCAVARGDAAGKPSEHAAGKPCEPASAAPWRCRARSCGRPSRGTAPGPGSGPRA